MDSGTPSSRGWRALLGGGCAGASQQRRRGTLTAGKARPKNGAPRRCEPAVERNAPIDLRLVVRPCTNSTSPPRNSHPNGNHSGAAHSSCRLWTVIVSRSLSRCLAKTGRGFDFLRHASSFLGFSRPRMPSPLPSFTREQRLSRRSCPVRPRPRGHGAPRGQPTRSHWSDGGSTSPAGTGMNAARERGVR
jgi:hypothetical protein